MPHTIKGQQTHLYRPSASRRPSRLSAINEEPRVRTRSRSNNLGFNYGPSTLLNLLRYNPQTSTSARHGSNVPALGLARDRVNFQRIINNARANYQKANTNAKRVAIYKQFSRNHGVALNALKRKHLQMMEELNALIRELTPANTRLTRSLQESVNALKASMRKR